MSFRGRGGGWGGARARGRFGGFGRGNKQIPFELFPAVEGLGTAEYTTDNRQLMRWSRDLQKFWTSSPYYYEDKRQRLKKTEKPDIERYSDKDTRTTKANTQLRDLVPLDRVHFPAELAEDDRIGKYRPRKIRWKPQLGQDIFDKFEKFEKLDEEKENAEKKESEDEEEEDEENIEDDGEYSDEGDYEQGEYCDDDEDDFNPAEDDNDEPLF